MKKIILLTILTIISLSCEKETDEERRTIPTINISNATDVFIVSEFNPNNSTNDDPHSGTQSLQMRTNSGEIKEIPLLATNGDALQFEYMGIATFNLEKILLNLYFSSGKEDIYIIDKANNDTKRIDTNYGPLSYLTSVVQSNTSGYTNSYNDLNGNLYSMESIAKGSQLSMVDNKNYTKEIIYNDKELSGDFAVDHYGNSVMEIYEQTWAYKSKDGESLTFQIPDNAVVDRHGANDIFALSGLDGFYYISKSENYKKYNLSKLSYDQTTKQMKSKSISNEIEISSPDNFYGVRYCNGVHLFIGRYGVLSINKEMNINYHSFLGGGSYNGDIIIINNSMYIEKYRSRFNLETLELEETYTDALLTDYRIDEIGCKADESIIFSGLNKITGEEVIVTIKDKEIVSEVPVNETNTIKCIMSWISF